MFRIAVLASSAGSNLQSIIDAIKAGWLNVELASVLSDKKDCYALERAHAQGYATHFVDPKEKSRIEFDREMVKILKEYKPNLIVLSGYMRILSPYFVSEFPHHIINIHPSLIPKFAGKDYFGRRVHEAVLKAGEKETGMTIHFVDEGVDSGTIILQKICPVLPNDTVDTLRKRVLALEKEWYPKVIQDFVEKKI